MLPFPVPSFEQQRLEIMQRYRLIAPPGVMRVSVLAEAAGRALGFPMVFAALTERHRDRFAVHWGIEPGHLAMVSSLCMRTNLSEDTFWVAEAEADAHFAGHLAVTDGPRVRAFAGAPMRAGGALGSERSACCRTARTGPPRTRRRSRRWRTSPPERSAPPAPRATRSPT